MFAIRRPLSRTLCWLLTVVTPLTPSASLIAQTTAPAEVAPQAKYVLPYSAAIALARPRQLLTCQAAEIMPVEVVQAACLKEFGFDALLVKQIVGSMIPPIAGPPSYAVLVDFTERIDLTKLAKRLTAHTTKGHRDGVAYLQSQNPQLPSLYWVGDTSLLIAPEHTLKQLLSNRSEVLDRFALQIADCRQDDLALLVNTALLRPFIQLGLNQAAKEMPAEFHDSLEIPSLLRQARLRINFSGKGPIQLCCDADDAAAAERVEERIHQLILLYRQQAKRQAAELLQSEDPVEQAVGRYLMRITPVWTEQFLPTRNGEQFTMFEVAGGGNPQSQLTTVAVVGVVAALVLPAVQAAREAARRTASMNNVRRIMLAMHNYYDSHQNFPAHANYSDQGKPLLSWRVHLLPYLDQQMLYDKFRLDEPWDSEHNQSLLSLMPEVYLDPSSRHGKENGRAHYLGVQGKGLAFDGTPKGRKFASFRDGTSKSIVVVQCNDERATPWTKPEDWQPDEKSPLAGLAYGPHPGGFLSGFADGYVRYISNEIDTKVFRQLLTIAGGEVVDVDSF